MTRLLFVVLSLIMLSACQPTSTLTHVEGLGSIDFPNSGSAEAQEPFYRGVLLLHSFEFQASAEAFKEAQTADSTFALAYWGEAMTYNHPLWKQKDLETGNGILARMDSTGAIAGTPREQMYVDAVRALYAEGSKTEQDKAYMNAMKALSDEYPDDDEARTFYGLSILGSTDGDRDFEVYGRAADVVNPVFLRNPNHPGAAHYLIHSYDDPGHAPLGLAAAEAYSEIAPGAAHAQHMTTHIFLAMGDWDRVIANNIRAMETADADAAARGLPPGVCGHYSSWRHYAHLQKGELEAAEALMDACFERVSSPEHRSGEWNYFTGMRGHHILSTEQWDLASRWMPDQKSLPANENFHEIAFTNALVALKTGDLALADSWRSQFGTADIPAVQLSTLEFDGYRDVVSGNEESGLAKLRDAADREAAMPFDFGPPSLAKPTHELLAEALAETGHTEEALAAYAIAESRTPGRWVLKKADALRAN